MKIKSFFKVSVIAVSVAASFSASAGISIIDNEKGTFSIGGDVEFDLTADDYSEEASADQDYNTTAGGRILIDINGERLLENGNFAAFKVNPLYKQQGGTGLDDAWFKFGQKNNWNLTLGHFEAGDLSPAGQDTYIVANTAYTADAARGRLDGTAPDAGQVMFQKTMGAWGFELSSMFGANEGQNMDDLVTKNKDAVIARPIVSWAGDAISVAFGAEVNLVTDAYMNGNEDASDWTGYGATTTIKVSDDLSVSLHTAFKDDNDADQLSAGIGAQYQNFFAHYLYGTTDGESATEVTENVAYASYRIPSILDLDNFDIYLAASYGSTKIGDEDAIDETGGRIRFKYFF